jgi:hypothetical protein
VFLDKPIGGIPNMIEKECQPHIIDWLRIITNLLGTDARKPLFFFKDIISVFCKPCPIVAMV